MGPGRVEAQDPGPGLTVGLWLSGVPLDGPDPALARLPGVAGALCAPGTLGPEREAALGALCDAFAPRPVAVEGVAQPRKANLVAFRRILTPAALDAAVESWFSSLTPALMVVDAARLDAALDAMLAARMSAASSESIRAAYRLLYGRVAWAVATVCRRRLETALNSRRAAALGAPRPRLVVDCAPERLADFAAPGALLAVPYRRAGRLPALPETRGGGDYDEARRLLDKLANYRIDLEEAAAALEAGR